MAIAILGQAVLLLAVLAAGGGAIASFAGGRRLMRVAPDTPVTSDHSIPATEDRLANSGLLAVKLLCGAALLACFLLVYALVGSMFTLEYVQSRTSRDLSFVYRVTSLWSGQEGSLLLWLTVLALAGALMVRVLRRRQLPAPLVAYATGTLMTVATFFAVLVAFVDRPFRIVSTVQLDGAGMSPSLQNYWMAAHPPALYLGYVGITVPFAIVVGALLARRRDDAWIGSLRGFTMASWVFLTLGLLMGARWAYEEIGWGGYWAWDPVENAALMPWLVITALLHSIMVQQRRGMMRFWNALLAMLAFSLSIFGTFLTRSGVLSSVHSFVSSSVGWWFIGALAVVSLGSLLLLYRSRDLLRAHHDVDAVVSREALLLFNNLLLVSLALVVLWGVVYPILTAAVSGSRVSLERPWYDFFAAAFGLPLTLLVATAPFIAWRGTPARRVLRGLVVPIAASCVLGGVLMLLGAGSDPLGVAAICLAVLVLGGIVTDLSRTVRSHRSAQDVGVARSLRAVAVRHRRRWGAWLAHAGLAFVVIAIAGAAWGSERVSTVRTGDTIRVGAYELVYRATERERVDSAMRTRARFDVRYDGEPDGTVRAGRDFYPASGETSNEVAVRHHWLRGHDLFVTVDRLTEDGSATVKALVNPLIPLLWLGGILTALGGTIAAWPARSRVDVALPFDTNDPGRVEVPLDAVHGLRNGTAAPRELLSGMRGASRRTSP